LSNTTRIENIVARHVRFKKTRKKINNDFSDVQKWTF